MGKKHPLELFRANPGGFENASRQRRTVTGRVVGTSLRETPSAVSAARGGKRPAAQDGAKGRARPAARKSSGVRGPIFSMALLRPTNRKALYGVIAIFGAFGLYLMGANNNSPALKRSSEEIFSTGGPTLSQPASAAATAPPGVAAPEFTILAATYGGSEHGKEIATITRDVLIDDGFPRTQVVGYPGTSKGEFDRFELLVGRAARSIELNGLLDQVRAYQGPPNDPAPFRDAYVIEVPEALRTGS